MAADPSQAPPLLARFVQRLTPITLFGKANLKAINQLADEVLPPHFTPDPEQEVGLKVCGTPMQLSNPSSWAPSVESMSCRFAHTYNVDGFAGNAHPCAH
jgi:hypothetical protein